MHQMQRAKFSSSNQHPEGCATSQNRRPHVHHVCKPAIQPHPQHTHLLLQRAKRCRSGLVAAVCCRSYVAQDMLCNLPHHRRPAARGGRAASHLPRGAGGIPARQRQACTLPALSTKLAFPAASFTAGAPSPCAIRGVREADTQRSVAVLTRTASAPAGPVGPR